MKELSLGDKSKLIEDASIEHTGVEVDASVPGVETELPLLVDVVLVGVVVVASDSSPIVTSKERIFVVVHALEVVVSLPTGEH